MRVRTRWIALVSAALIASVLPVHSARALLKSNLTLINVASKEVDMPSRQVYIWTPAVDSVTASTLPVLYILHGWSGSPGSMISATVASLEKSFNAGAQPFIAVFPDGNAVTHPDSEWADSSDKKAMIETWLIKSVIPAVEGSNLRTRANRGIMGYSMGGYGATIISLHNPTLFSKVISLAGYYYIDDVTGAFTTAAKRTTQNPATYLKVAPKLDWYISEGANEQTKSIRGQAATWVRKLKTVNANYKLTTPNAGHDLAFVTSQVIPITKWLNWSNQQ